MRQSLFVAVVCAVFSSSSLFGASSDLQRFVREHVEKEFAGLFELYKELHANPELSHQEVQTSRRMAAELKKAGFEVTTNVGGHGVVGVFRNGAGPTVLLRCDMDALPVKEQTGLPYASRAVAVDWDGNEVPVMHACGHDIHMTTVMGAGRVLAQLKDRWKGTLVIIAQPAEERGPGAKAMIEDGLFKRFPLPDYCIALHVSSDMPAGTIGYTPGFAMANVDSVDITIRGVGGHGAHPHATKDPIVIAAQTVLALQTIVARELPPTVPAVVTVGSIHGGTKHNIIPDEVHLRLTVRSYADEVRATILSAIRRIARGVAISAGVPDDRLPIVTLSDDFTPATYNDPALTHRLARIFGEWFGEGNVIERQPVMGGEDFGEYGRTEHKIPISMYRLGAVNPEAVKEAMRSGQSLPSLHSPLFAPVPEPTIRAGVTSLTAAVLDLMAN